eukprot:2809779-Pyramimonas_sp.AAC.1
MGIDANCALLPNLDGLTGSVVCPPAVSHTLNMRNVLLSLLGSLGLRALNTFAREGLDSPGEGPWTCGAKRRLERRTQIDYI